jgi:hypothetical protein
MSEVKGSHILFIVARWQSPGAAREMEALALRADAGLKDRKIAGPLALLAWQFYTSQLR